MQPRGLEVVMSSTASYPKAAGPAGQTAGRAAGRVGALVAPDALLNPAPEAECRGARPKGIQRRPLGRRRVRRGAGGDQGTCRKTGPAWRMSRGGLPMRGRMAGEPPGPVMETQARTRMRAMGSHPSRGPGGASRIACTPLGSKRVSRVSAAALRPPPRGLSGSTQATGKPRRRTPLPHNLRLSFVRPRRG